MFKKNINAILYMSLTLETYLKSLNLPSLKAIVRFHNQHQKIKMVGKKEELIQQLLSKYDSITDGQIKSKIFNTPTFDIKPKPRKGINTEAKAARKLEREEANKYKLLNKQRFDQAMANLRAKIEARKKSQQIVPVKQPQEKEETPIHNIIDDTIKKYKNMIGGIKKDKFLDELKQEIKQYEKRTNTTVKSRGIGSDDHLWYEKKRLSLLK